MPKNILEPILKLRKVRNRFLPHFLALLHSFKTKIFVKGLHLTTKILRQNLHKIAQKLRQEVLRQALKFFVAVFLFLAFACSKKTKDDPLILPPNFAEKPDPNVQEKPTPDQQQENVARLKELLLKNDE